MYYGNIESRKMSQKFASILLRATVVLVRGLIIVPLSAYTSIVQTSSRRPDTKSVSKAEKGTIFVCGSTRC